MNELHEDRPRGVPQRGKLGASRNEMLAMIFAVLIFAIMLLAFWFEARP